jgi:Predicted glycosyltransferases
MALDLSTGNPTHNRSLSSPVDVSIIVSTYNGERFLKHALESLLAQSFSNFELIVVDDGSTDATSDILDSFQDPRLIVVRHRSNLGIATSQNDAVGLAKGTYIALQDHDDVSDKDRIARQVSFLESNPGIGLVGSSARVIDEAGNVLNQWTVPTSDIDLKWSLLFLNPFLHTSLLVRRSEFKSIPYSPEPTFRFAEDFEWLSRFSENNTLANFADPLVSWRRHGSQASSSTEVQEDSTARIARNNIARLLGGADVSPHSWASLRKLLLAAPSEPVSINRRDVKEVSRLLARIQKQFYRRYDFSGRDVREHRMKTARLIGKHFLALACRGNGQRSIGCRSALLSASAKFVLSPFNVS